MKTITKILCPTDFSACAHGALLQALSIARAHDAQIDVLHITNVPRYVRRDMVGFMGSSGAKPLSQIALDECGRQMNALLETLSKEDKLRVTSHCRFGAPADTIMHYAEKHEADLIALGASGNARVSKYILGGLAGKTIRRAECPVLCVPSEQPRVLKKILVATDFSECSVDALKAGALIARTARAQLVVAHVTPSAWSLPVELNVGQSGQGTNWLELLQHEARERLDQFIGTARADGIQVDDSALLVGSPAQSLLQHSSEQDFDLIALGTHGRSAVARLMLGSVAETVVHHAGVPVLTVRSKTPAAPAAH